VSPLGFFVLLSFLPLIASTAFADCEMPQDGQVIKLNVVKCEEISAEKNTEVIKHIGTKSRSWDWKAAYTGALIHDKKGGLWMYSSSAPHPCDAFKRKIARKKAYYTCCDSGRWGKCVFGGTWLGDIDGIPLNTSQ
jgi:hypothetical protein